MIEAIHERMPVILPRETESIWLDPTISDPEVLKELLIPYPTDAIEAYAVSSLVNSPKNETPECILPLV